MKPDRLKRAQFAQKSCLGKMVVGFTGFILALSIAAGSAWSVEDASRDKGISLSQLQNSKDTAPAVWTLRPAAGDAAAPAPKYQKRNSSADGASASGCPPLLKTVRHTPLKPSADDNLRPSAGAAAVLGYTFGMRYALTPPRDVSLSRDRGNGTCS